jgi:hypothetical protein
MARATFAGGEEIRRVPQRYDPVLELQLAVRIRRAAF